MSDSFLKFAIMKDGKSLLWDGWGRDFWVDGVSYFAASSKESAENLLSLYPGAELIEHEGNK